MKKYKLFLILTPLLEIASLGLVSCFDGRDLCGNTTIEEIYSPTGRLKAVIFERSCGATTDFSTQISVFPAPQSLVNEAGNIFSADTNHGEAPAGPGGGPEVRVTWITDNKLLVAHHIRARIFNSVTQCKEVQITHNTFSN